MDNSAHLETLADQRRRWAGGERPTVETYLARDPGLASDPERLLDLIYNEFVLREEHGEAPAPEDYLRRFPQVADHIKHQIDLHHALKAGSLGLTPPTTTPAHDAAGAAGAAPAVPGYELLGELGRGGMGVVYKARRLALQRLTALKMVLGGRHASPRDRDRFLTEARLVARLQHPNIVQIYEVGEHDGLPFLSLEFMEGGSLARKLAGSPRPPREAAALAETLARAVHFAHRQGVVHRDLKPANVLLTADGIPKIADFGLAKLTEAGGDAESSAAIQGTPNYMAPEQTTGRPGVVGARADVYALGAILYELLTGRPPFRGTTLLETLEQVRSQDPVPPGRLQPRTPRDLEAVCLRCLEKSPERRYARAEDLADDLRRFLAGEPVRARPAGLWRRGVRWARRHPASASLAGAAAAALAGLVGLLAWHAADLQAKVTQARDDERLARSREQAVVERQLAEETARRDAQAQFRKFIGKRDDALFHWVYGTLASEEERQAQTGAARQAGEQALELAKAQAGDGPPADDAFLSDEQKAELASGCYELLVMLAEADTRPGLGPEEAARAAGAALDRLDAARRFGPPTRAWRLRRADCLELLKQGPEAERERAEAEAAVPATALDHFLLGDEHYRGGDAARAAADFGRALDREPNHFWALYSLGFCYFQLHRPAEARAVWTASLARRPDFPWTYLLRGAALVELREFPAADADFRKAEALGLDPEAEYALHVNRGALRLGQGRDAEADDDLRRAARMRPSLFQAHANLARLREAQRRPADALAELKEALALRPPPPVLPDLHVQRGRILLADGDDAGALRACDDALKLRPDFIDAQEVRGRALLALHQYAEAVQAFTRCLPPGDRSAGDAYRGRGQALVKLGRFPEAVDDYTQALGAARDAEMYTHRGWAYYFSDAWKLARNDFDEAVRRDPRRADAYAGRGLARVALGQAREAFADAEESLRRKPDGPEMLHNVACVFALASKGDGVPMEERADFAGRCRVRAVEVLRQALDLVPTAERSAFWREKMSPDPALDPIRRSAEFQKLAAEIAAP
jgi:tetratricopeptide (TPR) repeat protein